ncbi:hypothetical protein Tco_0964402 [Tanacetum coccineum]
MDGVLMQGGLLRNIFGGILLQRNSEKSFLAANMKTLLHPAQKMTSIKVLEKFVTKNGLALLWNKPEIETLSLDDLFNNLKAYEPEVKWTSNSTTNLHNVAFLSIGSTNNASRAVNTSQCVIMLALRKLDMTNKERIRYDKSKVECFNCHKKDTLQGSAGHLGIKTEDRGLQKRDFANGLESVKPRLLVFKKNESVYEEDIKLLKREIYLTDLDIKELKRKLDFATKEKDEVQLTVQNFENSSKNLSNLLDSQIMDKCKTGLGYNAVPPPYGNFMPPKSDLVYPSLDDFVDVNESVSNPIVEKPTVETNEPKTARKENRALIIKDWVSDSDEENVPKVNTVEMFNKPSFAKINFVKSTEQVKSPRKTLVDKNRQNTFSPRGNKRNWNQQMSQKLGSNFEMFNKAYHVCGRFHHLKNDCNNLYNNGRFAKPVWTNVQKVNKHNFSKLTHPVQKETWFQEQS